AASPTNWIVFHAAGGGLVGRAREADEASGGLLGQLLASGDFKGQSMETAVVYAAGEPLKRYVLVGLGQAGSVTPEAVRNAAGKAVTTLRELGVNALALALPEPAEVGFKAGAALDGRELAQAVAEGALLSLYQFNEYKTGEHDEIKVVDDITVLATDGDAAEAGIQTARVLAEAIALTRTLSLQPGDVITPEAFAAEARAAGEAAGFSVTALDEAALAEAGMNGILLVGQGSDQPPRLIVMEYQGGKPGEAPIAVVGKGVTFDTGGIGIKPGPGMEKMKYDMAGGAATLGIMVAAARLKLPVNLVGLIPAVENMPSEKAARPGDVVTMYNGLTLEFNDTDAEGRVVLADALAYAVKEKRAKAIVDMATLTGSVAVALGRLTAGVMSNDDALVGRMVACGEKTGERVWRLPIDEEHCSECMKSEIADLRNYGGRYGDAINAAWFLKNFVGETPWAHLDVAGTAWIDADKGYRPKGPTGMPVRLVTELLRSWEG
ncbi:MAG: leucyl aminopeptidase, partial [Candidatus Sericytochromatia bacterium]